MYLVAGRPPDDRWLSVGVYVLLNLPRVKSRCYVIVIGRRADPSNGMEKHKNQEM